MDASRSGAEEVAPAVRAAGRGALRWGARLLGVALVVYVVATQIRWHDTLSLADGTTASGQVEALRDGWRVTDEDGLARVLGRDDVAHETIRGRQVPRVAYGLPTLVRRLSGSVGLVVGVLFALVALATLTAWRWRWLVSALGLALTATQALRYTFYGIFFNLFVPGATGGDVVKAWYAARRTGRATKAAVSVLVDRLVGLFALLLLAAVVLFANPQREGLEVPRLFVGAVLAATVGCAVLVLSRRVRRLLGLSLILRRLPFQRILAEVDAAVRLYRGQPRALALGVAVSTVNHVGTCLCAYGLARALGLREVGLLDALALVPVASLLCALPLLPGGWGVGELAFAYLFGPLGVPPSEAVAWSVVFRLSLLASGLPGAALWLLSREHPRRATMAAELSLAGTDAVRPVPGPSTPAPSGAPSNRSPS